MRIAKQIRRTHNLSFMMFALATARRHSPGQNFQQHDAAKDRRDQTQQRANQKIFREALRLSQLAKSRDQLLGKMARERPVRKLIA